MTLIGKIRCLTPEQEAEIQRTFALAAPSVTRTPGTGPQALARSLAGAYGVSVRTIWRVLARRREQTYEVVIEGYRATFVVDELGPKQRTDWRAA